MASAELHETADPRPSRRRNVVALVVGLAGVVVLCLLGTWQVERLHWKEGIIRRIDERTHSAPQPADAVAALQRRTGDVEYVPVAARGRFRHADERFFLSTHDGQSGWNVYVPLEIGANRFVYVNRGFVPYEMKDPSTRRAGQTEGEAEVTGLARDFAAEKPSFMVPENDLGKNQFFWKSLADMRAGSSLPADAEVLPFVIDAGPGRAPGGWPVGGTTVIDIPNNHLQYAITWYGLAAALACMIGYQVWLARQPAAEDRG